MQFQDTRHKSWTSTARTIISAVSFSSEIITQLILLEFSLFDKFCGKIIIGFLISTQFLQKLQKYIILWFFQWKAKNKKCLHVKF